MSLPHQEFSNFTVISNPVSNENKTQNGLSKGVPVALVLSTVLFTMSGFNINASSNKQNTNANTRIVSSVQPSETTGRYLGLRLNERLATRREESTSSEPIFYGTNAVMTSSNSIELFHESKGKNITFQNNVLEFDWQPAYGNIRLEPELNNVLEGLEMNNHFFDVLGDRLYKTGFLLFGGTAILLLLLWVARLIPFEVGFVGFTMSGFSFAGLFGIKALFRRFADWN
ncbi:hypothetical protein [Paenibacillus amylolyticus]|uniref:hypothetical protein n=1 Tax=Paenibacillus amylolyticus TaxID=1451 RepID=UPI003D9959F4